MKEYIVAKEVSAMRSQAKVIADFDTLLEAEHFMIGSFINPLETVVCKRQSRNVWWEWDFDHGTGWELMEIAEVVEAKAVKERNYKAAQEHISRAVSAETPILGAPTNDVEAALRAAKATEHRAQAAFIIATADRLLLEVVLENHGNVEWPMVQ